MSKTPHPTDRYVKWMGTTYIHDVALVYGCRIYAAIVDSNLVSGIVSWEETRRKFGTKLSEDTFDLQLWFVLGDSEGSLVVSMIIDKTQGSPFHYKLRRCDVPLYGREQNYGSVELLDAWKGSYDTFREPLRLLTTSEKRPVIEIPKCY